MRSDSELNLKSAVDFHFFCTNDASDVPRSLQSWDQPFKRLLTADVFQLIKKNASHVSFVIFSRHCIAYITMEYRGYVATELVSVLEGELAWTLGVLDVDG